MSEYHFKRVSEIINQIKYITIATSSKAGKPWNSPVFCGFDRDLNFYWSSDKESQHSRNIRENSQVFLVIYDSTMPEGTGEGVYIEAQAVELEEGAVIQTFRRTSQGQALNLDNENNHENFIGSDIRRVYKASPEQIWMNDVENDESANYIRDIRIEVPLPEIRRLTTYHLPV